MRSTLLALATASLATAHFQLNYPVGGFNDDTEATGPCGGVTPEVSSDSPEITVEQFAVQIFTSHPTGSYSFFATTNTAAPYNFTEIVPVVNTTGAGDFCLTSISAPSDFAGRQGILQIVDTSIDGILYQCAPVRFVSGANSTAGPTCKNGTSFTAEWTTTSASSESNSTASSTSSAAASTSSSAEGAGVAVKAGGVGGLLLLSAGIVAAAMAL